MIKFLCSFLPVVLFLVACDLVEKNESLPLPTFRGVYQGSINDGEFPLLLQMNVDSGIITGTYFYTNTSGELRFSGVFHTSDSLTFTESVPGRPGVITGTFAGKMTDDRSKLEGVWYDDTTSYSFVLISAPDISYDDDLQGIKEAKEARRQRMKPQDRVVDLLKEEGITSLKPRLRGMVDNSSVAMFVIKYADLAQDLESVFLYSPVGRGSVKKLNSRIESTLNITKDVVSVVSPKDKRAALIKQILDGIDGDSFYSDDDGLESMNVYLTCLGEHDLSSLESVAFKEYKGRSKLLKAQLDRRILPKDGFQIYVENTSMDLIGPTMDFELRVFGKVWSNTTLDEPFGIDCR